MASTEIITFPSYSFPHAGDIRVCRDSKVSASGAGFRGAPQFVSKRDWVHGYVGESEAIGYGVRRQVRYNEVL